MDTSQQNKNPSSPLASQPQSQAKPISEIKPAETQVANTELFFNVMPQVKNQGAVMVEAKMKTHPEATSVNAGKAPASQVSTFDKVKKYKLPIIVILLLMAGAVTYYIVTQVGSNAYKEENILLKKEATTPRPEEKIPPATGSEFTTPGEWREKYFPNCVDPKSCGDAADLDRDGLSNLEEYKLGVAENPGADPNNPDSDKDGLADGDEVNVFGSDPLNSHSAGDSAYSDADYVKGGFAFSGGKKMTQAEIDAITAKMKQFDVHPPTIFTLGEVLNTTYKLSAPPATTTTESNLDTKATSSALSGFDLSVSAQQDRDTRRSNTIKNIGTGLVKYEADNKHYPVTNDFTAMFTSVKPYMKVAANPTDPVNKEPFVYTYAANPNGSDFVLSFYSEVGNQLIKKTAADAQKDAAFEEAEIYDNQRQTDLESLRTALLLYSQENVGGNQDYVFPAKDKYKTVLVPEFISAIPKDPKTKADYDYQVAAEFDAFTLKAVMQNPPQGNSGYICNQIDDCHFY